MRNLPLAGSEPDACCEDWPAQAGLRKASQPVDILFSRQQALLDKIIADKVIPRLLLANPLGIVEPTPPTGATSARIAESIDEFSELVIRREAGAALDYFEELREGGATVEALFQDLLAPVARRLGVLWEEDINDFLDVTRGISHLQQIVHTFSDELVKEGRQPASDRRALLMPMPGEQHTFGVSLIGEHFRREGWRVWGGPPRTIDDILELVETQWFDIVGLSMSVVHDPAAFASHIRTVRKASRNKDLKVLVGGEVFMSQPALASDVGADATGRDGRETLSHVTAMIGPIPKRL
ncbi:MAG: B12-binding domain-containing protein [Hyphomicrobium sp.]